MKDPKERIAAMLAVREELQKTDDGDLWEYYSPKAADMSVIFAVRKKLGLSFAEDHIVFYYAQTVGNVFIRM